MKTMSEKPEQMPNNVTDRPLVTFALFAYNQEKYIREAVEGAFAQTYQPLEIILSDDCSSDRTYEIMQEMAAAYKGPHELRVEQTAANLGRDTFGRRVSSLLVQAQGGLIVIAAGDDISEPDRVDALFQVWNENNRKAVCIHSKVQTIDEGGTVFGEEVGDNRIASVSLTEFVGHDGRGLLGATNAVSRKIIDQFGALPDVVLLEDGALGFRARLADGILFVPRALVKYRRHGGNLTNQAELRDKESLERFVRGLTGQHACYLRDYLESRQVIDPEFIFAVSSRLGSLAKILKMLDGNIWDRYRASLAYSSRLSFKRRLWLLLNVVGVRRN
jgi:glycosyltransferase involved in cell wall biosynthesis